MRHMSWAQRIDRMPGAATAQQPMDPSHESHALHEMAGLVLGITVSPRAGAREVAEAAPRRVLRLFANRRENFFGAEPGFAFILQDGERVPVADSVQIPGSLLLLRRGEPTQITVTNRIGRPLAVHWHGLELDSYYDGVSGWSGVGERIAPTIAPGGSFDARMTPPRAGTFIYHVHNDHAEELPSGLYGPLIVLEPDARYDPEHDLLFVISEAGPGQVVTMPRAPFVNGTTEPDTLQMVLGRTYRLRIVAIPANDVYAIALKRGDTLEQWREIALDGADIPAELQRMEPAFLPDPSAGDTFDLEFRPTSPGVLTLEVEPRNRGNPLATPTPTIVPIRVSAP
jgi:FtsP/CotA-like multicopper oxidase with cupredoxin domain